MISKINFTDLIEKFKNFINSKYSFDNNLFGKSSKGDKITEVLKLKV